MSTRDPASQPAADAAARAALTAGLRELADFIDANPGVPVSPYGDEITAFPERGDDTAARAAVDQVAAMLGSEARVSPGGHYTASRSFGLMTYKFVLIPAAAIADHDARRSYDDNIQPGPAAVAA